MTNCFRTLLFGAALCITTTATAQKTTSYYQSQISVISENDNYTFKLTDRYYTNGLMLRFSKAIQNNSVQQHKKILTAEIGQMIYNPYKQDFYFMQTMDRPFTGFLYTKAGLSWFSGRGHLLRWNVLAGVIGKAAKGREVQQWHHHNFNLTDTEGWDTQLSSEFGANVQGEYFHHLLKPADKSRIIDLHAKANLVAGTLITQASTGLLFKFGAFENAGRGFWGEGHLTTSTNSAPPQRKFECYLYFEPSVTAQFYNATVQGGMFTKEKAFYTTGIQPFFYSHTTGLVYAKGHLTTQLGLTYKTKEARTMRANESYGTIGLSYRF